MAEQRLLDLAKAQHLEFARLLEELNHEVLRLETPGSKLGATRTLQPELVDKQETVLVGDSFTAVRPAAAGFSELTEDDHMQSGELCRTHTTSSRPTLDVSKLVSLDLGEKASEGDWKRTARKRLNYVAGVLIFLNTILMAAELELSGTDVAGQMGWEGMPLTGFDAESLRVYDALFDLVFAAEFCLRIWLYGSVRYFFSCDVANWWEFVIVLFGLADFVFILLGPVVIGRIFGSSEAPAFVHMMRAANSLRILRTCRLFKGLRGLLKACEAFVVSLAWAMVLLVVFMSAASIMIGNLLQEYLLGDASESDRLWIWQHYGTAYRSFYTLYELTFAGNWPTRVRPVTDTSPLMVIPFFGYITLVSFALIRVITAVFLKDTMEAAQNDSELALHKQMNMKAQYVKKLEEIFKTIDESGQGIITEERLKVVLADPHVQAHMRTLDLDVHEGAALFHLLDNGDGEVTLEEFTDGILRCKGPARAVEQVAMQAELRQLDAKLKKVLKLLSTSDRLTDLYAGDKAVRTHLRAFTAHPSLPPPSR